MSRIQDILSKAERDGTARRTRSLPDDYAGRPGSDERLQERGFDAPAQTALVDETRDAARPLGRALSRPAPSRADERPRPAETSHVTPVPGVSTMERIPRALTGLDPHLVAALAPMSLAAEQYRSLRTRLKRAENGRLVRTIAITSPAKGDGKSLTAANLALTMAQEFQQRVVLVDCDFRRPAVHRLFGLGDGPGLCDVLMGVAELDDALTAVPEHHLTVLPAGAPPANPAEVLGSAAMRRVLETLRSRFDRVLIDVPPVAPLADLHILAPMIDGLLMIVRAGITQKPAIERALSGIDSAKVLGLVLNETGSGATDTSNYDGYGYIGG